MKVNTRFKIKRIKVRSCLVRLFSVRLDAVTRGILFLMIRLGIKIRDALNRPIKWGLFDRSDVLFINMATKKKELSSEKKGGEQTKNS